jgi:dipeptide transport system substrate-binding protein
VESDPVRGAYVDEIAVRIVGGTEQSISRAIDAQAADLSLDTPPPASETALPQSGSPSPSPSPARPPGLRAVPSGCLRYLWMNTTVTPFNDVRVRRAVAQAIDRAPILAAAGGDTFAVPATSPLVRTLRGAPDAAPTPAPSPQPSAAAAVFRSLRLARGFSTTLVVGNRPVDVQQARAVVDALRAAGSFPVRITTMPIASVYVDAYEVPGRKTPMGIATWCADWPGLGGRAHLTPLLHGRSITHAGNQNYAMFRDAVLNGLLDAAVVAPAEGAAAAWRAAADRVQALAPWVPLLDLNEVSKFGSRVAGFVAPPMFPRGDLTAIWLRAGAPPPATPS